MGKRARPRRQLREERRSQLALLSRLPAWARELWEALTALPPHELRRAAVALRSLARLVEHRLSTAPNEGASSSGAAGSSQ